MLVPYKRKTVSKKPVVSYRKKSYRRKPRVARNFAMVNQGVGFPKMTKVILKYSECPSAGVVSTSGVMSNYRWSCNSLFDPNNTGGGHQPMGFDQYMLIYNHYCVIGSKVTFTVTSSAATNVPVFCGMFINDDTSTTATDFETVMENTSSRWKIIPPSTNNSYKFSTKWSAKKYFGKSPLANNDLQGTQTASPPEQSYFNICTQALDRGSSATLFVTATVEYIAIFKELREVPAS